MNIKDKGFFRERVCSLDIDCNNLPFVKSGELFKKSIISSQAKTGIRDEV